MWLYLCKRPQHLVRSKSPMAVPVPSPSSLKRNLIRAPGAVSASAKLRSDWGYPEKLSRVTHMSKIVMMKPFSRGPSSYTISCSLDPSISLFMWSEISLWNKGCHSHTSWIIFSLRLPVKQTLLSLQSYQWNRLQFPEFALAILPNFTLKDTRKWNSWPMTGCDADKGKHLQSTSHLLQS